MLSIRHVLGLLSVAALTIRHVLGLLSVAALTLVLMYFSRFWIFFEDWWGRDALLYLSLDFDLLPRFWIFEGGREDWWGRDGLFGYKELHRNGDFLTRVLRGTPYQVFSLLFWLAGGFLMLSLLQTTATRVSGLVWKGVTALLCRCRPA